MVKLSDAVSTDLWWRHDREGVHDAVRVLFTDLADEQRAHARASATTQWVCQLEALQTVAALGFLADDVKHRVDQLGALRVVTLGPVVAGTALTKHEVVWAEDLAEWTGADRVHRAWLKVNENGTRYVLAACIIHTLCYQLQVQWSTGYSFANSNNPFNSPLSRMTQVSWYQKNIDPLTPCLCGYYITSLINFLSPFLTVCSIFLAYWYLFSATVFFYLLTSFLWQNSSTVLPY